MIDVTVRQHKKIKIGESIKRPNLLKKPLFELKISEYTDEIGAERAIEKLKECRKYIDRAIEFIKSYK